MTRSKKYIVVGEIVIMGRSKILRRDVIFSGDKYKIADVKRQLRFGNIKPYVKPKDKKVKIDN